MGDAAGSLSAQARPTPLWTKNILHWYGTSRGVRPGGLAFPKMKGATRLSAQYVLEMNNITKIYGETKVLDGVQLKIRPGDNTPPLGQNAAGQRPSSKGHGGGYRGRGRAWANRLSRSAMRSRHCWKKAKSS